MLTLIAGVSTLISGISKVKELFSAGKELKEHFTGEPSKATTPDELAKEIAALPVEQQTNWLEVMKGKLKIYEAQTERLRAETDVAPEIAVKVDVETASKIAYERQTTRPWAVKKSMHFILFPFYLVSIDVLQVLINNWIIKGLFRSENGIEIVNVFDLVFGASKGGLMNILGSVVGPMPKTLAGQMYMEAIVPCVSIVITFMTLRQVGKSIDKGDDGAVGKMTSGLKGLIKKTGLFGK